MCSNLARYFCGRFKIFVARTNMHGFNEIYAAKNRAGLCFWAISLTVCFAVTAYQICTTVRVWVDEPYVAVVGKLNEGEIVYPPLYYCYKHWLYWADFKRAARLNFTKEATLYGLSYSTTIFSADQFDTIEAKERFVEKMNFHNFTRISQFYSAIAKPVPGYYDRLPEMNPVIDIRFVKNTMCYVMDTNRLKANLWNYFASVNLKGNHTVKIAVDFPNPSDLHHGRLSSMEEICHLVHFMYINYYSLPNDDRNSVLSTKNFTHFLTRNFHLPIVMSMDSEKFEIAMDGADLFVHLYASVSKWQNVAGRQCRKGRWSTTNDKRCDPDHCNYTKMLDVCLCHQFEHLTPGAEFDDFENLCPYGIHWINESMNICREYSLPIQQPIRARQKLSCTTLNQEFCCNDDPKFDTAYSFAFADLVKTCEFSCVPGCTIWNYDSTVHKSPTSGIYQEFVRRSYQQVVVFLPSAEDILLTMEIESQSLEKFVGNIGGLLGIWTGASILSLIQLVYLCCFVEFECFKNLKTKNAASVV